MALRVAANLQSRSRRNQTSEGVPLSSAARLAAAVCATETARKGHKRERLSGRLRSQADWPFTSQTGTGLLKVAGLRMRASREVEGAAEPARWATALCAAPSVYRRA
ncbi:hypothetical protein MRX96_005148 [Rhipicephalus microplus]